MPIYEYGCPGCGLIEERFRPMSESHMGSLCPNCGAETPRIPSRFGFEIPGFKHGQRIDADEIGERAFERQKYLSEEAARNAPPTPHKDVPPQQPKKDLPLQARFEPADVMTSHASRLQENT